MGVKYFELAAVFLHVLVLFLGAVVMSAVIFGLLAHLYGGAS